MGREGRIGKCYDGGKRIASSSGESMSGVDYEITPSYQAIR